MMDGTGIRKEFAGCDKTPIGPLKFIEAPEEFYVKEEISPLGLDSS